jgi:hypothetical protein
VDGLPVAAAEGKLSDADLVTLSTQSGEAAGGSKETVIKVQRRPATTHASIEG